MNEEITLNVTENSPYVIGAVAYVEQLEDGAKITIIDKNGTTTATVDDGNGIQSVTLNADYTLTIFYTDGTSVTTTSIRGETGASGVYVGEEEPENPDVDVWIDTTGDPYPIEMEITEKVDEWLDSHPEATTTVQDGAITVPKFAAGVVDATLTQTGHPADAKATGDAITADRTRLTAVEGEADALDARITNLAQLTDGSTTGDAELMDARVVGSTTYSTLHQAIDTEFGNVKSALTQNINGLGDGRQYFDYTWGSINGDGTINYDYSPKTRVVTPTYMKFGVDTDIRITTAYYCIVALYNNDYSLISRTVYTGTPTATIPADTYFRVCVFHGSIVPNSIYDLSDKVYYDSNVQKSLFGLGFYGSSHLNLSTTINRFDCDISEGDRVKVTVNIETVGTGAKNVQIFYVENGTSTLIETFYANGDYYFYAPTDMSRLAVLLNTAGSITSADVNVTIKTGAYQALDSIPKVYHCEKDGSGDFTKLTDAINTAMQFMDSVVYVGAGTWDLIDELGSAYVETISESNRGLYLKNRVHIICNPDSLITWHYAGSTADVIKWGCAFNSGEYGFTLENAHIETSNCRYTIHDERDYATDFYENKYINCVMKHDNTVGGSKQCIGGGLGKNGRIVVHGCIFENVKYNTETDGGWVVSYHNTWNVDGGKSFIEISDNYFKGNSTMHFGWFGNSTEKTPIICTNNSIGHSIYFERETTEDVGVATDIVNLELFDWNNIIRS